MKPVILIVGCALLLGGCATSSQSKLATTLGDGLAAASGGAVAYVASNGNATATASGALGGLAIKKYADHVADKAEQQRLQAAYDTAHADATRQLYDAIQRQQSVSNTAPAPQPEDASTLLPLTTPQRVVNGVILDPAIEYIRITDK